jgi:hypothetical protein
MMRKGDSHSSSLAKNLARSLLLTLLVDVVRMATLDDVTGVEVKVHPIPKALKGQILEADLLLTHNPQAF